MTSVSPPLCYRCLKSWWIPTARDSGGGGLRFDNLCPDEAVRCHSHSAVTCERCVTPGCDRNTGLVLLLVLFKTIIAGTQDCQCALPPDDAGERRTRQS